jgi:hypothetical protein
MLIQIQKKSTGCAEFTRQFIMHQDSVCNVDCNNEFF